MAVAPEHVNICYVFVRECFGHGPVSPIVFALSTKDVTYTRFSVVLEPALHVGGDACDRFVAGHSLGHGRGASALFAGEAVKVITTPRNHLSPRATPRNHLIPRACPTDAPSVALPDVYHALLLTPSVHLDCV